MAPAGGTRDPLGTCSSYCVVFVKPRQAVHCLMSLFHLLGSLIAIDKALFTAKNIDKFSYFMMIIYVVGTH